MRKILGVATLLCVLVISGCLSKDAVEKKPIKIAISEWAGDAHAVIAKEKGFFEKNNVDVELIFIKEYSESQENYINGETDGIFGVYSDTILYNLEGIETKVVCALDYSDTGDVIIGNPELNSLADLKGKKIGIEGVNSFSHLFVLASLKKAGIEESEVQFEDIPAHKVLEALEDGIIYAGHTWEPTKSAALKKGYKILGIAGDVPGIITDVLSFSTEIINERPDDIRAIVKALLETLEYLENSHYEDVQIMTDYMGMSKEEMEEGIDGIKMLDIDDNIKAFTKTDEIDSLYGSGKIITKFYFERGQLSSYPDFDEILEPKFVKSIKKEK
ncbi:MAG: ABC transporter substrate-binding protein [Waddliaceae bacterium]|jgi:NitT/TauT family transport system substrate-binding protein|nr:ABC transporter substrate-binding protein [Waddliaceae bacterium]MBT3578914.1 ABC transporter substrate-binding protein [Waddliaceae bacterium]MBT6929018.1 ABC transporter substrate-binding protein [Waddliaceae bacterium]MBT7461982.1 ABC transporter substrate-binding protein [Waddliaceae bacterium]